MPKLDGYLRVLSWRKAPVRLHWSAIALFAFQFFVNKRPVVGLLAFVAIILLHELGHAFLVQRCRLRVREIRLYAFGGECIHDATSNERDNVLIAWGGVLAQLMLCLSALGVGALVEPTGMLADFLEPLVFPNLMIAAFNLLPISPLDGYTAWRLNRLSLAKRRGPKPSRAEPVPQVISGPVRSRKDLDALIDNALLEARSQAKKHDGRD